MAKGAAAGTVAFTFEEANGGPTFGIEYGSLDLGGFPKFVRNGFVIDVPNSGGGQSLHFHETDSIVNPKVPDRPVAQRGVLWRDGERNENSLIIAPETPAFMFEVKSLVVGSSSADGSQTSAVQLTAFLGATPVAIVQLAAPVDAYAAYSASALGPLSGVVMDRLEVGAIGTGATAYYQLDDLVFETTAIPEPGTLLLGMVASVVVLLPRRRRA